MLSRNINASEAWKPVFGWEGFYEVSDHGRVRSVVRVLPFIGGVRKYGGEILSPARNNRGYYVANLTKTGHRKQMIVHRLVLEAFVGVRPAGMVGCHNDGDRGNNHLSNLRWDTPKANAADMVRHGTHLYGERNAKAILTDSAVLEMRVFRLTPSEAAAKFGVSASAAKKALYGKTWKHVHVV